MKAWKITVALNTVPGLRAIPYHRALDLFGSPSGILEAGRKGRLCAVTGIGPVTEKSVAGLDVEKCSGRELALAEKTGADLVTLHDKGYPALLREIPDPPAVLYVKGDLRPEDGDAVAVVGSRAASEYGRLTAERLGRNLAARGITVISGLARGIDSCAHRGALDGGGRTIAVLGSGLDRLYPPENRGLAERISGAGAVVTEFPFGSEPSKRSFPLRNRVVSGLALGVVVVEAAERSGALITGGMALDQGREVFAVPGNITSPLSAGTNGLLREGARPVTSASQILEEFPHLAGRLEKKAGEQVDLTAEEQEVLSRLGTNPVTLDEMIRRASVPTSRTLSLLTALELKGLVRRLAGGRFARP